jgi:putative transposase
MKLLNPAVARVLKRLHYPLDIKLMCERWYVAHGLRVRNLEEMMAEHGIQVDHSTVHRWAIKLLPVLEKAFRHHKRPVGRSWRVDETYIAQFMDRSDNFHAWIERTIYMICVRSSPR